MTFARVLSDTGLTRTELATLYGVSRQTIHYWVHGASPWPNSKSARQADAVTAAIEQGLKSGKFPLRPMKADVRKRLIEQLGARLQNLKPAPIK